ncbi:hypothetical protein FQR65_LT10746 [Abscondita terminalis]|nr:hypothetical protein FQR65_LT10746 [Abscondita terminalis]
MITTSVILFFLINVTNGVINNVCPTYQDYISIRTNHRCWYDVAADQNATTIITSYGYGVETHKVVTSDGYVITMFRIVNPYISSKRKVPVLLQHGLLYSGACFIGKGKDSLGFILADAGYDVWLANMRGTEYSEEHVTFKKNDIQFWSFNVDDIGLYEITAELNYIAQINSENGKIIYIGHSMGGTTALMYASTFPEEAKHLVKLFILLAPNGGAINTRSIFLRSSALVMNSIVNIFINTEFAKLLANGALPDRLASAACLQTPFIMNACINILNLVIMGLQRKTDASIPPILFNQFPSGTSLPVLKQIGDTTTIGLRAYDFGRLNVEKYGTLLPPIYNVSKIEVPIYLVHSNSDGVITKTDTDILFNRLLPQAKVFGKYEIVEEDFNHNDFLLGKTAKTVLYDKLLLLINSIRYV